ncbi:MAG: Outer membrane protein assembly factor BamB [Phycisphaerae bacterium]|nr:Outer membrane protein assembly factor BamB [Phycisphaerae bacterium]
MNSNRPFRLLLPAILAIVLAAGPLCADSAPADAPRAGLAVVLGADAAKSADLAARGYYVQALDADAARVAVAREALSKQGLYGVRVAVDRFTPPRLPLTDNTVNLLAAEGAVVPRDEILRVLAPGGEASLDGQTIRKPRPDAMGDWTHPRCGPDGNPVSRDTLVAPSRQIRWLAGPLWGHHCGPAGGVCADGRIVYVLREQPLGERMMPRYRLMARDASNGLLLWSRPVPGRSSDRWPFYTPQFPPAALVASGDRIYTVAAAGRPLEALDSRTGRLLKTYDNMPSPESIVLSDGVLILSHGTELHAANAETGRPIWNQTAVLTRPLGAWSSSPVVAADGRTIFRRQDRGKAAELISVETKTGRPLWSAAAAKLPAGGWADYQVILAYEKVVLLAGNKGVCCVSDDDGRLLWHRPGKTDGAAFGMDGRIWLRGKTSLGGVLYGWTAVDPATGQADREVGVPQKLPEGIEGKRILDGQCNFEVATPNYIVTTTRMSLLDVRSGRFDNTMITRGPCKFLLAIPANGLLYSFPKDCVCYPCLRGMVAYGPAADPPPDGADAHPLIAGPAQTPTDAADPADDDWPTYRGNPQRGCATASAGPAALETMWAADIGGRPTAPVVSGGRVYVAAADRHTLHALDAATGATRWRFIAGGRIDSPPTITRGLCIFGCRDGWVYALRANDGRLVWRLRAAPAEGRIPAFEQLESPWPAFGAVLSDGQRVYASAGHHANAAGGIGVFALSPATGKVLWRAAPTVECVNNVLTLTPAGNVYLAYYKIAWDAKSGQPVRDAAAFDASPAGYLNDETLRVLPSFDAVRVVDVFPGKLVKGRRAENVPGEGYEVTLSRRGPDSKLQAVWTHAALPVRVNAVALAPKTVYLAGGNDAPWNPEAADPWAVIDGGLGGSIMALSADDGGQSARAALDAPTVRDGLAVAGGRLYAATRSGKIYCMGRR